MHTVSCALLLLCLHNAHPKQLYNGGFVSTNNAHTKVILCLRFKVTVSVVRMQLQCRLPSL